MLTIAQVSTADFPDLLALNAHSVPHVNDIDGAQMARFLDQAVAFFKVTDDRQLAGFVIALGVGADYDSPNYTWFSEHSKKFLYIDRIMVHPDFRRRGIARLIYADLIVRAQQAGCARLCCEVNLQPPNPDSLALHQQLGFTQVGTQQTTQGTKEVALLVKELDAASNK
jgi:predicted GNAT superfamily acetyltransferase